MNGFLRTKIALLLTFCALVMLFCACNDAPGLDEDQNAEDEKLAIEQLCAVLTEDEIAALGQYPNLKAIDFETSTCYDAILKFAEANPQVDVSYRVSVGKTDIGNKDEKIILEKDSFDYASLAENLLYLPALKSVEFDDVELDAQQIKSLSESFPEISFGYTLTLFGQPLDTSATELDLSEMDASGVARAAVKLPLVTSLSKVVLSDSLDIKEVARLQDAVPGVFFDYSFSLFGKQLSTADKEVVFTRVAMGNESEGKIREALDVLDECERFVLDDCGFDYELLAKMREDYRGKTKVVWRVYYGTKNRYKSLTDDDTLRAVYNVTDETCGPMKYCEDVVYMDIGHNEDLTDLSFVGYMPKIEVLIASGCAARVLPGFENCKKLVWLELCFCPNLENIESLYGCESLRFVNLSYTNVKELDTLHDKPLERFLCLDPKVSAEEEAAFLEKQPEDKCLSIFHDQTQPYGYGWHYDDHGYTYSEYYKNVVREAFDYDYLQHIIATKGDNFD